MIVFLLLVLLWIVITTMVVLSASIMFARMSRIEEERETIKHHQTYVLQSTEEWPAAANSGAYDRFLS